MPQFIPMLLVSLVMALITTAIKVGIGMISKSLAKKKQKGKRVESKARENKANITDTIASLPVVYGRSRIGCSRIFIAQKLAYAGTTTEWQSGVAVTVDTRAEYLYMICAFCVGEIDDIEQIYIDGVPTTDPKFSSGYRVNVGFSWVFVEPDPIVLTSTENLTTGYGGNYSLNRSYYQNQGFKWVEVSSITGYWQRTTSYLPDRYFLYKIVNGQKIFVISFKGGTQYCQLTNASYGVGEEYVLEYHRDNGEIIAVGNATATITQDNVDFVQSVNNNLTLSQSSSLASEYIQFTEKRGIENQEPLYDWLNQGVPNYSANMTGENVVLGYFRFLMKTNGSDLDKAPFNGIPEITADIRGKKVLDTRTSVFAYNNNPAMCLRDYLMSSLYGVKIDFEFIDEQSFKDVADYCDELITASDGITQIKRFVLNGALSTDNEVLDNVFEIMETMNASLFNDLGQWKLVVEKVEISEFTFDENNMIGDVTIERKTYQSKINTVNVKYINESTNWETDIVTIKNDDFVAQDKGKQFSSEFELTFCNDYEHAYYLGLTRLKKERSEDLMIVFDAFWNSFVVMPGTVVSINREDLGFSNKLFRVKEIEPQNEDGLFTKLKFTCTEYDPDVYSNLNIDPKANNVGTSLPDPFDVKAPTGLLVTQSFEYDGLGQYKNIVNFKWESSVSINVREYQLDYKTFGFGEWVRLGITSNTILKTYDMSLGKFEVRIKARNTLGAESDYYTEIVDVFANNQTPPQVSGFQLNGSSKEFSLKWDAMPEIANNGYFIIRHSRNLTNADWNDIPTLEIYVQGFQNSVTISQIDGTYMIKAINSAGLMSSSPSTLILDSPFDSEYALVQTVAEAPSFSGEIASIPQSLTQSLEWNGQEIQWNGESGQWTYDIGLPSLIVQNNTLTLGGGLTWDQLDSTMTWDDLDPNMTWDQWGGNQNLLIGVYNFANSLDLGGVYKVVLEKIVSGIISTIGDLTWDQLDSTMTWDDLDPNMTWDQWGGTSINTVKANLFVRYTRDNPMSSPLWTEWQLLTKNELVSRACQFKLEIISSSILTNIELSELSVKVWLKNRIDQKRISVSSENQLVSYSYPFYSTPNTVSLTLDNGESGEYTAVSYITNNNFIANIKDSNNLQITRYATATTYGIGERLA